jgi:hypothetical protein
MPQLKAAKMFDHLIHNPTHTSNFAFLQVTMTASTLYEAVEPQLLWKHLLTAVFAEIVGDGSKLEVCSVVMFASELGFNFEFYRQSVWFTSS